MYAKNCHECHLFPGGKPARYKAWSCLFAAILMIFFPAISTPAIASSPAVNDGLYQIVINHAQTPEWLNVTEGKVSDYLETVDRDDMEAGETTYDWVTDNVKNSSGECLVDKKREKDIRTISLAGGLLARSQGQSSSENDEKCEFDHSFFYPQNTDASTVTSRLALLTNARDVQDKSVGEDINYRREEEELVRKESFKALSREALLLDPVKKLNDLIRPFTRLFTVYRDQSSGQLSTRMFKSGGEGAAAGQKRIAGINLWLSSENKLSATLDLFGRAQVFYEDFSDLRLRYMVPMGYHNFSFEVDNFEGLLFGYHVSF